MVREFSLASVGLKREKKECLFPSQPIGKIPAKINCKDYCKYSQARNNYFKSKIISILKLTSLIRLNEYIFIKKMKGRLISKNVSYLLISPFQNNSQPNGKTPLKINFNDLNFHRQVNQI